MGDCLDKAMVDMSYLYEFLSTMARSTPVVHLARPARLDENSDSLLLWVDAHSLMRQILCLATALSNGIVVAKVIWARNVLPCHSEDRILGTHTLLWVCFQSGVSTN